MDKCLKIIRSSNLFEGITEDEAKAMLICLNVKIKKFSKDEFLLREGDFINSIGIIISGSVLIVQEDMWGNRNIVEKVTPAQTFATAFACANGSVSNVSVVADEEVQAMFIDVSKIMTVCSSNCSHHNKIIHNLIADLAKNNLNLNDKITHMGKRTTREKIMSYLSAQSNKAGSREFNIPYSRQQMADYLGVERSGLSLELSKMKREGLIDFNKNHFLVKV